MCESILHPRRIAASLRKVGPASAFSGQQRQGFLEQRAHRRTRRAFGPGEDQVSAAVLDDAEQRRAAQRGDGLGHRAGEGRVAVEFCNYWISLSFEAYRFVLRELALQGFGLLAPLVC